MLPDNGVVLPVFTVDNLIMKVIAAVVFCHGLHLILKQFLVKSAKHNSYHNNLIIKSVWRN